MEAAAKAPADGYTIYLGNIGTISINPAVFPTLAVNPAKDFIAVSLVAPEDRANLAGIEKLLRAEIPAVDIDGFDCAAAKLERAPPVKPQGRQGRPGGGGGGGGGQRRGGAGGRSSGGKSGQGAAKSSQNQPRRRSA